MAKIISIKFYHKEKIFMYIETFHEILQLKIIVQNGLYGNLSLIIA